MPRSKAVKENISKSRRWAPCSVTALSAMSCAVLALFVFGWLFLSPGSATPLGLPIAWTGVDVGIDPDQIKCSGGWLAVAADAGSEVGVVIQEISLSPGAMPPQAKDSDTKMYMSAWTCASRSVVLLLEGNSPLSNELADLDAALAAASTATIVTDVDVLHKTATGLGAGPLNPDETQAPDIGRAAIPYTTRITAGHHSYGGSCPVLHPDQTAELFQTALGLPACKHILVSVPIRRHASRLAIGSILRRAAAQAKASHLLADTLTSTPPSTSSEQTTPKIQLTRLTASSSAAAQSDQSHNGAVYASPEDADCSFAHWLGSSASTWIGQATSSSSDFTVPGDVVAALPVGGCTGSLQDPGFMEGPKAVTVPISLPNKVFSTTPITVTSTLAVVEGMSSLVDGGSRQLSGESENMIQPLEEQLRHAAEAAAKLLRVSPGSVQGSAGWRVLGHLIQVARSGDTGGGSVGHSEEHAAREEDALRAEAERAVHGSESGSLPPAVAASMSAEEADAVRKEFAAEMKRQAEDHHSPPEQSAEEEAEEEEHREEENQESEPDHLIVIVRTVLAGHSIFDPTVVDLAVHGQMTDLEQAVQDQSRVYSSDGGSAVVLGGSLVPLHLHDALLTASALEMGSEQSADASSSPSSSSSVSVRSAADVLMSLAASHPDSLGGKTIPRLFLQGSLAESCGGPLSCVTNGCRAAYSVGRVVGQYTSAGLCPSVYDGASSILLLARRPVTPDEAERESLMEPSSVPQQCKAPVAAMVLPQIQEAMTCEDALSRLQKMRNAPKDAVPSEHDLLHPAEVINGVISDVTTALGRAARECAKHHKHGVAHEEEVLQQMRAEQRQQEEDAEDQPTSTSASGGGLRGSAGGVEPLTDRAALARDLIVPAASHMQSVFEQCALLGVRSVTAGRATMSSAASQERIEEIAPAMALKTDSLISTLSQELSIGVRAILSTSSP